MLLLQQMIMAVYVALVVVMLVLNYSRGGWGDGGKRWQKWIIFGQNLIDFLFFRRSDGPKQVIDYEEGEGATNRLVEEGDDDERDNVAELWDFVFFMSRIEIEYFFAT